MSIYFRTPEEMTELYGIDYSIENTKAVIKKELGINALRVPFNRNVLVAAVTPPREENGIPIPETSVLHNRDLQLVYAGKILAFGEAAFRHREEFPFGPRFSVGDWVSFSPAEFQKCPVGDFLLGYVKDIQISGLTDEPEDWKNRLQLF